MTPSPGFVETETALRLAQVASHYGITSPAAAFLGIRDDVLAFATDEALMLREQIEDRWAAEERRGRRRLPSGQRYATDRDYDDSDYDPAADVPFPELLGVTDG